MLDDTSVMAPLNNTSAMILLLLLIQNSSYTVLRKYSTMTEKVSSREVLLVGELIKICVSIYFILTSVNEVSSSKGVGINKLLWLVKNSLKMVILSGIYLAMNVLSFVSLQYIGAGEFTICAQLKILTTAGFSAAMLGTSISSTKWRALAQLVIGCILVTSPVFTQETPSPPQASPAADVAASPPDLSAVIWFGYGAVVLEVVLSGFASIYFERVVKSTAEVITVWERNFQLAMYSVAIYAVMIYYDYTVSAAAAAAGAAGVTPEPYHLFQNWSILTCAVAFLGAAGGLLVAATLKYSDAIMKTLATAGAIVISTAVGHAFLGGVVTATVVLGGISTIISIFSYTFDQTPPSPAAAASSANAINGGSSAPGVGPSVSKAAAPDLPGTPGRPPMAPNSASSSVRRRDQTNDVERAYGGGGNELSDTECTYGTSVPGSGSGALGSMLVTDNKGGGFHHRHNSRNDLSKPHM